MIIGFFVYSDSYENYYGRSPILLITDLSEMSRSESDITNVIVKAQENSHLSYDINGYVREDVIYLFLPSTMDLSSVAFHGINASGSMLKRYEADLLTEQPQIGRFRIIAMQSSLPTLYLDVDERYGTIEEMNQDENHETFSYGTMRLDVPKETAIENGWQESYLSVENDSSSYRTVNIRGRGNKTWELDKRPYQFKLEKKQDLLGMGAEKTWLLLANALDNTLLKNQVMYKTAQNMQIPYSVEYEPVDVYMNGEYLGNYLLCEKVEVDENRVEIDEQNDYLLEWGGTRSDYMIEFDECANMPFWWVKIHSPKSSEKTERLAPVMKKILEDIANVDSDAYVEQIDLTTWAQCYWIQEFCVNGDAVFTSIYLYYKGDEERLYMGPVWDLDNTCGYPVEEEHHYPDRWATRNEGWYTYLFQHENFRQAVNSAYQNNNLKEIFRESISILDEAEKKIEESAIMDYLRWRQTDSQLLEPYEAEKKYKENVQKLRDWLTKRYKFIESEMNR